MNDTTRMILIALGIALLVIVLLPLLFMSVMMTSMMTNMMGSMMGGPWMMVGLVLLVLVIGATLVVLGVRRQ